MFVVVPFKIVNTSVRTVSDRYSRVLVTTQEEKYQVTHRVEGLR